MNQILVTQKLYVTPELRRKRKIYKIEFTLSLIVIFLLGSYYIYADYDRNKSEQVSQELLAQIDYGDNGEDATTANKDTDILVVSIDDEMLEEETQEVSAVESAQTYATSTGASYTSEARLEIKSLGIDYPVLSEQSDELLKISLNKYWGPKPNEIGNYCIVGHNYKNGKMFGKLNQIQNGDVVSLTDTSGRTLQYEVYNKYIVDPNDRSCTSQLTGGYKELSLITCTNYGQQRLVVKCREIR